MESGPSPVKSVLASQVGRSYHHLGFPSNKDTDWGLQVELGKKIWMPLKETCPRESDVMFWISAQPLVSFLLIQMYWTYRKKSRNCTAIFFFFPPCFILTTDLIWHVHRFVLLKSKSTLIHLCQDTNPARSYPESRLGKIFAVQEKNNYKADHLKDWMFCSSSFSPGCSSQEY